jgi:hypothetical protein
MGPEHSDQRFLHDNQIPFGQRTIHHGVPFISSHMSPAVGDTDQPYQQRPWNFSSFQFGGDGLVSLTGLPVEIQVPAIHPHAPLGQYPPYLLQDRCHPDDHEHHEPLPLHASTFMLEESGDRLLTTLLNTRSPRRDQHIPTTRHTEYSPPEFSQPHRLMGSPLFRAHSTCIHPNTSFMSDATGPDSFVLPSSALNTSASFESVPHTSGLLSFDSSAFSQAWQYHQPQQLTDMTHLLSHASTSHREQNISLSSRARFREGEVINEQPEIFSSRQWANDYVGATDSTKRPKKSSKKKPAGMPRRPLSAFNLFFSDERVRILESLDADATTDAAGLEHARGNTETKGGVQRQKGGHDLPEAMLRPVVLSYADKRPHRKSHGKIGFRELAKLVGQRWKQLTPKRQKYYQDLAQKDLLRHKQAMEMYNKMEADKQKAKEEDEQVKGNSPHNQDEQAEGVKDADDADNESSESATSNPRHSTSNDHDGEESIEK